MVKPRKAPEPQITTVVCTGCDETLLVSIVTFRKNKAVKKEKVILDKRKRHQVEGCSECKNGTAE